MRTIFHTLSITALALAGCASPQISVKEKWSRSIANYDLVPLYPMREDVFIGDVRIHRVEGVEKVENRLIPTVPFDRSRACKPMVWHKGKVLAI